MYQLRVEWRKRGLMISANRHMKGESVPWTMVDIEIEWPHGIQHEAEPDTSHHTITLTNFYDEIMPLGRFLTVSSALIALGERVNEQWPEQMPWWESLYIYWVANQHKEAILEFSII